MNKSLVSSIEVHKGEIHSTECNHNLPVNNIIYTNFYF